MDFENEQIIYKDYVNIGIAIDTERGLVVPNIRNADQMSIPDIAKALADLASRVRGGEFGVNELRGGTFYDQQPRRDRRHLQHTNRQCAEVAILLVGPHAQTAVVMERRFDQAALDDAAQSVLRPSPGRRRHGSSVPNELIAYLEAPSRLLLAIN